MSQRFLLLTSLVLLAATAVNAGQNWPEFRGPTGQGIAAATRLPLEWSDQLNVAWKQPIPGRGWSSPVLQDGRLYLTTAEEGAETNSKRSLRALCLEASTGKILWNHEVFNVEASVASRIHTKNSSASPTPLVAEGRIYVHFGPLGTACLDLEGKVIWRNTTLDYPPVHGNGGSPILAGNKLIFSCDGASDPFVVALDKDTGEVLWKTPRETEVKKKFSFSTPLLITVDGQQQIISPGSGAVCAYEPNSGKELWRVRFGEGYSIIPRPVFGHGLLFITTGYDRPTVMAIRPGGAGDLTETNIAWTLTKGAPNTPSLILVGEELYMVSDGGIASCVDAKTGAVHWQERIGGNYSASPIAAEGRIYFQNEEGTGTVLSAGKEFQKLATNVLGERTLASYAATDGALFIRTAENLYKLQSDSASPSSSVPGGDSTNAFARRLDALEESLGHLDAKLSRQMNELLWFQRLSDVALVDKVRFTGPPPRTTNQPAPRAGSNEVIVSALTFLPRTATRARKLPLVVFVHGEIHGNVASDEEIHVVRELVEQGYAVIAPDYRGSSGYGGDFWRQIDYGGREVDDVHAARRWMLGSHPQVDRSRVGIIGWSHGGLIALLTVFAHPDDYQACYAGMPVSDLLERIRLRGKDYEKLFAASYHIGKTVAEAPDEYRRRSPAWNAEKLRTPLLVHANTNDDDVTAREVQRLIDALQIAEKQFEHRIYTNAPGGHLFNRLDTAAALESRGEIWRFLAAHLRPAQTRK